MASKITSLAFSFAMLFLASCSNVSSGGGGGASPTQVGVDSRIHVIGSGQTSITLNDVNGKTIYFVRANLASDSGDGAKKIAASNLSTVSSYTGFESGGAGDSPNLNIQSDTKQYSLQWQYKDASSPYISVVNDASIPSASPLNQYKKSDIPVGTEKKWYVQNGNSHKEVNFKAQAVGDSVIIWEISDSNESTSATTNSKVTQAMCERLRDKFEGILPYETSMFGAKASQIKDTQKNVTADIRCYTQYANFTNILVFNFEGVSNENGLDGFFTSDDYTYGSEGCNCGNFLYVSDTNVYNADSDKKDDKGVAYDSFNTCSHEYMHSLQHARKCIEQNQPDWKESFGEMLGQLCEYAMGTKAGIPNKASVINYRFETFMNYYYTSGLLDFNKNESENGAAYPVTLAFGLFLIKNYGGQALLSDMVTSADDGWDAIINGIRRVQNKTVTKEVLLQEFVLAYTCKDSDYYKNMKKDSVFTANGENFSVDGFDPLDLTVNGYFTTKYPLYMFNASEATKPLRPEGGIPVCKIGSTSKANSDSVTININRGSSSDEMLFLVECE